MNSENDTIQIGDKHYKLEEAWVIPDSEVETVRARDYGDPDEFEVDLARKEMSVKKAFVLVEVSDE